MARNGPWSCAKPGATRRRCRCPRCCRRFWRRSRSTTTGSAWGGLNRTSNFLRFVGDDGIPLEQAQALGGVSGNSKTLHERHLDVVVEPGRPSDMTRRVYPTPKSRRARDAYPHLVMEIEDRWYAEYGEVIPALRKVLETMGREPSAGEREGVPRPGNRLDAGLPDYPDTNGWIHRLWHD